MKKYALLLPVLLLAMQTACSSNGVSEAQRMQLEKQRADAQKAESDKAFKELDRKTQ